MTTDRPVGTPPPARLAEPQPPPDTAATAPTIHRATLADIDILTAGLTEAFLYSDH